MEHRITDDPELELCEAKSLFDSLAERLARKPPDEALTRMAGSLTRLIDELSNLGKEPLPAEVKARQVRLLNECTALSGDIRKRVVMLNRDFPM
jgi:hypothetical protein